MPAELRRVVAVENDRVDAHLQPLLGRQLRHHGARCRLHRLCEHAAMPPVLARALEVQEQVARPFDDFVSVPVLRWHARVRRYECLRWRGDEAFRVVGAAGRPPEVLGPTAPAGLLRAHAHALVHGAAQPERRLLLAAQRLGPDVGLPDHRAQASLQPSRSIHSFQIPDSQRRGCRAHCTSSERQKEAWLGLTGPPAVPGALVELRFLVTVICSIRVSIWSTFGRLGRPGPGRRGDVATSSKGGLW